MVKRDWTTAAKEGCWAKCNPKRKLAMEQMYSNAAAIDQKNKDGGCFEVSVLHYPNIMSLSFGL